MPDASAGLRSVLSHPLLYRIFHNLVGGQGTYRWLVAEQLRPRPGDRVLDIGCGPGHMLDLLPAVSYTGFDMSEPYIKEAQRRYGDRGRFYHASVTEPPPLVSSSFDFVLAMGVLHHLDDKQATEVLMLAREVLREEGRLVTCDPCFVEDQSPIARYFLRRDRGRFIRSRDGYEGLAQKVFHNVRGLVRHDLLRIPYTHLILQCTGT